MSISGSGAISYRAMEKPRLGGAFLVHAADAADPDEELTIEVRGAFDDIEDIRTVPTPFTPESESHPLAPVAGPIEVLGAEPGHRHSRAISRPMRGAMAATSTKRMSTSGRGCQTGPGSRPFSQPVCGR